MVATLNGLSMQFEPTLANVSTRTLFVRPLSPLPYIYLAISVQCTRNIIHGGGPPAYHIGKSTQTHPSPQNSGSSWKWATLLFAGQEKAFKPCGLVLWQLPCGTMYN